MERTTLKAININSRNWWDRAIIDELNTKMRAAGLDENSAVLDLGYSDYSGADSQCDKCLIEKACKEFPDNIVWRTTDYSGKIAYIFGSVIEDYGLTEIVSCEDEITQDTENLKQEAIKEFLYWHGDKIRHGRKTDAKDFISEWLWENGGVYGTSYDYNESKLLEALNADGFLKHKGDNAYTE